MILDTIAQATKLRVEQAKQKVDITELVKRAYQRNGKEVPSKQSVCREDFAFEKALMKEDISFICEIKKASPSKGVISEDFPYLLMAKEYEIAGADAISVLTEPEFFQGSNQYLTEISRNVNVPILRKDFIIDEYQIYEAKVIGADAILLIGTLLDTKTLKHYIKLADSLGMSALVETHTEKEINSALAAGAKIIGVNNRDLKTFQVNLVQSIHLRELVPKDVIFVAESGIRTAEDIVNLKKAKVDGVLIGETLMRSNHIKETLVELKGGLHGVCED